MDYYTILGIHRNATQEEIKAAYKREALKYHPDKNGNSPESVERFKLIGEAYQALTNRRESKQRTTQVDPFDLFNHFFSDFNDPFLNDPFFRQSRSSFGSFHSTMFNNAFQNLDSVFDGRGSTFSSVSTTTTIRNGIRETKTTRIENGKESC
jgi:DnaJ-class molecular chaperone